MNWINIISNLESDKIGFYFSFFLHLLILLFVIGIPNLFHTSSINIPTVIPIEIINVSDSTSLPKEIELTEKKKINNEKIYESPKPKKFNNIEPELMKKLEIKNKPEEDTKEFKAIKEKKIIEQKIKDSKDSVVLNNNEKIIKKDISESLPTKKIKPKIKPQPKITKSSAQENTDIILKNKPNLVNVESATQESTDIIIKDKPKPQKNFNLASMLKDLRNDKQSIQKQHDESDKIQEEKVLNKNEEGTEERAVLSISEIDLLIQQLSRCWQAPAGAVIKKGMVVKISAKIKPDRHVLQDSIRIIDTNISKNNPFYGPITESTMKTLLKPNCTPLKLPEDKYDLWKNLTINFDHSIMKGYQ